MYRRYEDAIRLEDELDTWMKSHPRDAWDDYDYEYYMEMKDRINFAWQDEEYDENF